MLRRPQLRWLLYAVTEVHVFEKSSYSTFSQASSRTIKIFFGLLTVQNPSSTPVNIIGAPIYITKILAVSFIRQKYEHI